MTPFRIAVSASAPAFPSLFRTRLMPSHYEYDIAKIDGMTKRELESFSALRPRSAALDREGREVYLYGAPMHWIQVQAHPYPMYVERAQGSWLWDVDGLRYIDLVLGGTGAMFGHANPHLVEAISRQVARGSTTMLPNEDSLWVGRELQRRFGLDLWQHATTSTDANRFSIRIARMVTGRARIIVFNGNYHGSVDDTQVEFDAEGKAVRKRGVDPNGVDHTLTTRLVEFNDLEGLEEALKHGDVAAVLCEPMLTNVGLVPALPGFHEGLRDLTKRYSALLIFDETHTIACGPGGYTRLFDLKPDMLVVGKAIGGGVPCAVYGMTAEVAERLYKVRPSLRAGGDRSNGHWGFGGTLAGNHLATTGMRASFEHVLTEEKYKHMFAIGALVEESIRNTIERHGLPWHVVRMGTRVEYKFVPEVPRNGSEAKVNRYGFLDRYIQMFMLNRGVIVSPFRNVLMIGPDLTREDAELHNSLFEQCVAGIV